MIPIRYSRLPVHIVLSISLSISAIAADSTPRATASDLPQGAAAPVLTNPTAQPVRPSNSAKIDKGELLGHIQYLSSTELNGREAGTADQLKAAQYVADEFKRYGLEPFGDEKDGARGYFQQFPLKSVKGAKKETSLKLNIKDRDKEFELKKDFAPFPAGLEKTRGKGEVAFAGYGIIAPEYEYDDFGDLDLTGKWALILRYEPQEGDPKSKFEGKEHTRHASLVAKIMNCAMRHAIGVLICTGPAGHEKEPEKLTDSSGGLIGEFSIPVFQITRAAADEILKPSSKKISELQQEIDKDLSRHSFVIKDAELQGISDLDYNIKLTSNVIARITGTDDTLKEECVIIGAHCDHIGMGAESSMLGKEGNGKMHPGADDNASGTAGLLEIAQYCASLKPEERPKRSVIFMAFSGEEKGLLGSKFYLDHPKVPVAKTAAMLNLDMIGRSSSGSVQVAGIGTGKGFKELLNKLSTDDRLKVHLGAVGTGPSDHASFYEKKIPVLFFFTGTHADYHRPSDTWDKINAPVAEAVADLASKCLLDLANTSTRPEYQKGASGGFLGVAPDAKRTEEKGYVIGQVVNGSPAEQAGLKAGDTICSINGQDLSNAGDLPMSLMDYGAGDVIEILLKRGNEKVELKATLGKRK